jgi:cytoskeletal protein RodZ
MKLRQPDRLWSHRSAILLLFVILFLVGGIWAFQLTQFFQQRLGEAPTAVTESQQRWDAAIAESDTLSEQLPVAQGDFGEVTGEIQGILKGEAIHQETLNRIAQDLLIETDPAQAEEHEYAEEE